MGPKLGFDILINSTPRTFPDRKDTAYDAARLLKSKNPKEKEIVEIWTARGLSRSTYQMAGLAKGRTGYATEDRAGGSFSEVVTPATCRCVRATAKPSNSFP